MAEPIYIKRGRRYIPCGNSQDWSTDVLMAGQWRLEFCPHSGSHRYAYDVRPDTAGFVAAAQIAQEAMESAMNAAAVATPSTTTPYTHKQLEIIKRFRAEMAAAGGFLPDYWTHTSANDIAKAGIDAVRKWGA